MLKKLCLMSLLVGFALVLAIAPGVTSAQAPAAAGETTAGAAPPELALEGLAVPSLPLAKPVEYEVLDIPNDDGTNLGVLFRWDGAPGPESLITINVQIDEEQLKEYAVSEADRTRLDNAIAALETDLAPLVPERDRIQVQAEEAKAAYDLARNNRTPDMLKLCRAYYALVVELENCTHKIEAANDRFTSRTRCGGKIKDLRTKVQLYDFIEASLRLQPWVASDIKDKNPGELDTAGDHPELFGHNPPEADKLFIKIDQVEAPNPEILAGTYTPGVKDKTDIEPPRGVQAQLLKNHLYQLRMVVKANENDPGVTYDLGGAETKVDYFNVSLLNNFIFAILFSIVILAAIMLARRNPNMFIRRIQGLEAVDEAIGRATEMGKPVLYLCGIDALASLNTLAAINVLGRVARRIADYDSDLIVPCKDPVVLTVAQEVVKEAYIDQGRPDAFREDKIFFLTDDQFAYTAAVCGIMMREKPAAIFLMGGYAAEALLLAETGSTTGAIQIAGTDSLSQLPFFITACDYTLIGEELYAASAYLSREPLLLGSLKGQDLGKALIMILIILQTLLFIAQAILSKMGIDMPLDFLKTLVQPL
jgi:hypothetical protein